MVKILANGDIVPDNDPRAQGSTQRRPEKREAPKSQAPPSTASEENVIVGDLARMVGVYGKTQQVMGRDVPLIYLMVGALLALLWISGNTNVIRMLALGFVLYVMYRQYSRSQGGSGGGQAPEDNSSRGHVINRGRWLLSGACMPAAA